MDYWWGIAARHLPRPLLGGVEGLAARPVAGERNAGSRASSSTEGGRWSRFISATEMSHSDEGRGPEKKRQQKGIKRRVEEAALHGKGPHSAEEDGSRGAGDLPPWRWGPGGMELTAEEMELVTMMESNE